MLKNNNEMLKKRGTWSRVKANVANNTDKKKFFF